MPKKIDDALSQLKRFDAEEALAYLEALEEKKKREEYIKFWQPYAGQGKIFEVFRAGLKEVYLLGGNRSGKTVAGAAIATAFLLGKEYFKDEPAWEWVKDLPIPEGRPRSIWVVGLDYNVVRDVIWKEKLVVGKNHPPFVPKNLDKLGGKLRESDSQIIAPDGSVLTCKSADSGREKFQGASVDLVWIDEECDVSVYDECYQRTLDCEGMILCTLTPLTDTNSGVKIPWVFQRVQKGRSGADPDIKVVQLSVLDSPFITDKEKERLQNKWSGHAEERARLYGDFIQRAGLVYPMFNREAHCITDKEIPRDVYRFACIDPAPSGPTACLWGAVYPVEGSNGPGDIVFYREYKQANLVVSDHAKNILAMNGGDPIDMWIIDPVGGGQKNAETHKTIGQLYRENGIPVRMPTLPEDFGLEAAREYLTATLEPTSRNPKAYMFKSLAMLQEELAGYVWDFYSRGEKKGLSKDKPLKRNDHLINCMQYMMCVRPRGRKSSGGETLEQRQRFARNCSYT